MRFVLLTHSLVSDWNHGNAHFQRGVLSELQARGHDALALEPADGWSRANLIRDRGPEALARFEEDFPTLRTETWRRPEDIDRAVDGADVVVVHEWTDPAIVSRLGRRRAAGARFVLLFHDTHHRAVSAPAEIDALDLDGYDAVLAFGDVLTETYRKRGWARQVQTWHEAADTRIFEPRPREAVEADLVWIGNWGDGERAEELNEFLVAPVRALGLAARVHGVRYPDAAVAALGAAGIDYRGWVRNRAVPETFARHRVTIHVPRRHYAERLPGIPTIRMFEALACGIPLVSAPWDDAEGLFRPGEDYLTARSGAHMRSQLRRVLAEPDLAESLGRKGRETILRRHTCGHRVDELFAFLARLHPARFATPDEAVA